MAAELSARRVDRATVGTIAIGAVAAAVVGLAAAARAELGVAAAVAFAAVPAAIVRPKLIAHLLVVAAVAESVTVAGVSVGRLAAPVGLVAVVAATLTAPLSLRAGGAVVRGALLYAFIALASLAWTIDPGATEQGLATVLTCLVFLFAAATLVRTRDDLRRVLTTAVAASAILGLVYIVGFLHGASRQENGVGDPNFVATFMVAAIPVALALASTSRDAGARALFFVAIAVMAAATLTTLSRGGFSILAIIAVLVLVLPVRTMFRSLTDKIAFFLAGGIGLTLLIPLAWTQLTQRFEEALASSSLAGGRGDLWHAAVLAWQRHPLTGIGYGAFSPNSFRLLSTTPGVNLASHLRAAALSGEPVHNAFVESLAELGPLGLLAFTAVLVFAGHALLRAARASHRAGDRFGRSVAVALMLSLIAFAIASITLSTEGDHLLWFLFGLSVATARVARPPDGAPAAARAEVGFSETPPLPRLTETRS